MGIKDAEGLSSAIKAMTASVAAYDRAAVTDRFLIEAMSPKPLAELIVTLRADPHFGPSLVIGSGGVLTELVRDARTVLLPASKDEIERALCSLRVARLLEGYRGSRQADIPRIADALHRLCTEFLKARGEVAEIEINPMFVYPDHIVAVDALIQVPRS